MQEEKEERERDIHGNVYKTAAELKVSNPRGFRAFGEMGVRRRGI